MNDHAMDSVMQRLARLERAQRRWKLVGSAALTVLGFVILLGAAKRQEVNIADAIWARQFVLADGNGKVRGVLRESNEQGGAIHLMDQKGETRLLASVSETSGPTINLVNANETVTMGLGTDTIFLGPKAGFSVQIKEDGRAFLSLKNPPGKSGVNFIAGDGRATISLRDEAGRIVWSAP
jgi:hypothetical protein